MSEDRPKPLRVAVVGGGIAGLSLAIGILKEIKEGAKLELTVYEQASKFAEIGAGVSLGPNSQKSLVVRRLHDLLCLNDRLNLIAISDSFWAYKNRSEYWDNVRKKLEIYGSSGGLPRPPIRIAGNSSQLYLAQMLAMDTYIGASASLLDEKLAETISIRRADFLNKLIDLLPTENCKHNKRVVDYESHPTHAVLKFADGTSEETDLIVACDGVKSPLRKQLYAKRGADKASQQEKYAEWIAWRGLVPGDLYEKAVGRSGKYSTMFLGLDRHILTFPVKGGTFVNIVGFVRDPEHKKLGGHTAPWAEDRPHEEMLEDFKGFYPPCVELMKAIPKPSIWGIFDLPPLPFSIGDRIILTGDAAHGTTPHQGAGAGQATEDALFLSRLLGQKNVWSDPTSEKLRRACELYQEVRHERAAQVQITSAQAGLLYEGRGVKGEGQDRRKVKENLDGRMKWIWEYDVEANLNAMLEKASSL